MTRAATTRARALLVKGAVTLNDEVLQGEFGYIKPGDVLRIGDGFDYVVGNAP